MISSAPCRRRGGGTAASPHTRTRPADQAVDQYQPLHRLGHLDEAATTADLIRPGSKRKLQHDQRQHAKRRDLPRHGESEDARDAANYSGRQKLKLANFGVRRPHASPSWRVEHDRDRVRTDSWASATHEDPRVPHDESRSLGHDHDLKQRKLRKLPLLHAQRLWLLTSRSVVQAHWVRANHPSLPCSPARVKQSRCPLP